MRKTILSMMIVGVLALLAFSFALAASYDGAIWTGKPNVLGIGYYCTAAQNKSGGDTSTHWAQAKTWRPSGGEPAEDFEWGNTRAVASTGKTHPSKGWGAYGETGWSTSGWFKSSAWD